MIKINNTNILFKKINQGLKKALSLSILFLILSNLNANEQNIKKNQILKQSKKMNYEKGKKIFKKVCKKDINLKLYSKIEELQDAIKNQNLCKRLNKKQLESLSFYLWQEKKLNIKTHNKIRISNKDRCPVCGMFVAKYPSWSVQIIYTLKNDKHYFSFDGVKDLMKFYFNPKKWGHKEINSEYSLEILVKDYYKLNTINAKNAFYVIGSNIYGPMGKELIAFENENDAKIFNKDHQGNILKFKEIKEKDLYK